MRSRYFLAAIGLALGLFAVAACGDEAIEQGTAASPTREDPSGSVSSPPATGDSTGIGGGQAAPIRSRSDLVDARAFEPDSVVVDPSNDQRLLIRFWGGVEPCYGVEVRVVETTTEVKLTILGGTPREAQGKSCIALAKFYEASADLASPLGARTIVVVT